MSLATQIMVIIKIMEPVSKVAQILFGEIFNLKRKTKNIKY